MSFNTPKTFIELETTYGPGKYISSALDIKGLLPFVLPEIMHTDTNFYVKPVHVTLTHLTDSLTTTQLALAANYIFKKSLCFN